MTKYININNIKELNDKIQPDTLYLFDKSYELSTYFNDEYMKMHPTANFTEISLTTDQITNLFNSLLDSSNAIDLLLSGSTDDLYAAYNKFKLTSHSQLSFLMDYIFYFLPNNLLYTNVIGLNNTRILPQAKAVVSLIPITFNKALQSLINIKYITISTFITNDESIKKYKCVDVFMLVTKNQERAGKICKTTKLNIDEYTGIKSWVLLYDCVNAECKQKEKNDIKSLSGLNDVIYIY